MRRIYEMGWIFLLMLFSVNIFVTFFASLAGVTVEFSDPTPTNAQIQGLFGGSQDAGSISIVNQIASAVTLPINFLSSLSENFAWLYNIFFGYEAVLKTLYLPTEIVTVLRAILAVIVVTVVTVTGIDSVAALRGGRFG